MSCPSSRELLARFVDGRPLPPDAAEHVAACPSCRGGWAHFAAITEQVSGALETFVDLPLQEEILARTRLSSSSVAAPSRPHSFWRVGLWGALPLAAAAALAFWLVPLRNAPTLDAGFRARGGLAAAPDRWVGLTLYRTSRAAPGYERVSGEMRAGDALLFGYLNRPESGLHYLAAVAVDGTGKVYWYHPAHETGATSGQSLAIAAATAPQELSEAITQPLSPGWLRIYGIFSRTPLATALIEQAMQTALEHERDVTRLGRLPLADTGQHTFLVKVER